MKMTVVSAAAAALLAVSAGTANAGIIDNSTFFTALSVGALPSPGFFLLGGDDVVINGLGGSYVTPATNTPVNILATMTGLAGGVQVLTTVFEVAPGATGELFPALVSGATPLNLTAQFTGANGGGTPIALSAPTEWVSLRYEFFDEMGSQGVINVPISGAFSGSWGVNLGPNTAIGTTRLEVTATVVPTPGAAALLGLAGLVAGRRRRA